MKIIDARVRWNHGWTNTPDFELLVDKIPKQSEDLLYETHDVNGGKFYYAEKDGYVHFLLSTIDKSGFGGSAFTCPTVNGVVKVVGPWSSRPACVNALGFGPCMSASLTDSASVFKRGYTFLGGAISLGLAKQAASITNVSLMCYAEGHTGTDMYLPFEEWTKLTNGPFGFVISANPIKYEKASQ